MFKLRMAKVTRALYVGASWVICSDIHFMLDATPCICNVVLTAHEQGTVARRTTCLMVGAGLHTVPSCVNPAAVSPGLLALAC